jgi:hypothetical protein
MNNSFTNLDGVIEYEATLGLDNVRNNPFDEDNFYPMDGGCRCGCCPKCERKSNALGGLLPSRAERQKNRARRQARKDMRVKSKLTQSEAQKIASQSLGKDSASDIALANALASSSTSPAKSGMSKNTKTALIVGGVIVVGVLGYFAYKKFSKKGK